MDSRDNQQDDNLFETVLVTNIPSDFHADILRGFFTQCVETGVFHLFHFKRRPQSLLIDGTQKEKVLCCPVRVKRSRVKTLFQLYHNRHWEDKTGSDLISRCGLLLLGSGADFGNVPSIHPEQLKNTSPLDTFPEMNPPNLLVNGNVGTPTQHFLDMIRQCLLPARLIKTLGLQFPYSRSRRTFGNVPYDYGNGITLGNSGPTRFKKSKKLRPEPVQQDPEKSDTSSEEEDWDRHTALHGDAYSKRRGRERLYEKEEETVWEKGGSGLVFHTDTAIWDEEKGGFDERTADDWDVDTGAYFGDGPGDKDAADSLTMRREVQLRSGTLNESVFQRKDKSGTKKVRRENKVGQFEQHTRGVGRQVMEKQGWSEGMGLGPKGKGMAEALDDSDGQHPFSRAGFGYHGEKLDRNVGHRHRPRRDDEDYDDPDRVIISTIYDRPIRRDAPEPLMFTAVPTAIKFRSSESKFIKK